jgi:response regulator of citrate/malate metabolism
MPSSAEKKAALYAVERKSQRTKPGMTPTQIARIRSNYADGYTLDELAEANGVSPFSIRKYVVGVREEK